MFQVWCATCETDPCAMQTAKTQIRLCICAVWSVSSLFFNIVNDSVNGQWRSRLDCANIHVYLDFACCIWHKALFSCISSNFSGVQGLWNAQCHVFSEFSALPYIARFYSWFVIEFVQTRIFCKLTTQRSENINSTEREVLIHLSDTDRSKDFKCFDFSN